MEHVDCVREAILMDINVSGPCGSVSPGGSPTFTLDDPACRSQLCEECAVDTFACSGVEPNGCDTTALMMCSGSDAMRIEEAGADMLQECALMCLFGDDECSRSCLVDMISRGCVDCYIGLKQCAEASCPDECEVPQSAECTDCLVAECEEGMMACGGPAIVPGEASGGPGCNASDRMILMDGFTPDEVLTCVSECGADSSCTGGCATMRMVSGGCSSCFETLGTCMAMGCSMECDGSDASACAACACATCNTMIFDTCAGIPIPGC